MYDLVFLQLCMREHCNALVCMRKFVYVLVYACTKVNGQLAITMYLKKMLIFKQFVVHHFPKRCSTAILNTINGTLYLCGITAAENA